MNLNNTPAELEALQKEVERWKKAYESEAKRDGKWIDEWGSCRTCGGEIPHGHTETCDVHKLQMKERENRELREALQKISDVSISHDLTLWCRDEARKALAQTEEAKP